MATWAKEYMIYTLIDGDTGEYDEDSHTVIFRPTDGTADLSTSVLSCGYRYRPDSDGDTSKAYDIMVDGTKIDRIWGPDLMALLGEE